MKTLITLILATLLLGACSSSHHLKNANFDSAIAIATKKIRKKNSNQKEIDNLKYAYSKANQIDNDRLAFLFESGEDDIWDEVHRRYTLLNKRQDIIKTLPDDVLLDINYKEVNYGKKLADSKKNAAAFYYSKGIELVAKKSKYSAREAYDCFVKTKKYYANYKDVEQRIVEAKHYGTNYILFSMVNQSKVAIPEDFEDELLKIGLSELDQTWISYHTRENTSLNYDYFIQLSLRQIVVSPEDTQSKSYTEEKEIEAGFKYQLDQNGNVQKDTAGNDVKLPIYKIITCTVKEMSQYKEAVITGTVDYIDTVNGQLIKSHAISTKMIFDHHSAEAFGDVKALKNETAKKIGIEALPYPTNPQMILDAVTNLKANTKKILYDNRTWLDD